MQQPARDTAVLVGEKTSNIKRMWALLVIFMAAVAVTLLAIFALANWAEASVLNHGIQHALIFLAGCGAGTSLLTAIKTKKDV